MVCSKNGNEQHPTVCCLIIVQRTVMSSIQLFGFSVLVQRMNIEQERLSHLVGARQAHGFVCGLSFGFLFKQKNSSCFCNCVLVTMTLTVLLTPVQLASMTILADVRNYAEVTTTVRRDASESLGNVTTVQIFGLVTMELLRQLLPNLQIFGSLSRMLKEHNRHLVSSLQSRSFSWQSYGGCRGKLLDYQVWIPFWLCL